MLPIMVFLYAMVIILLLVSVVYFGNKSKNALFIKAHKVYEVESTKWAKTSGSASVGQVIGLAIGVYVLANLLPGAITAMVGGCSTAWPVSVQSLWMILPLIIIVFIIYMYFKDN